MNSFAAKDVQHDYHQPDRERREQRSTQGLVDTVVDHLRCQQGVLAAHLADTIEDHDGITDRVADEGQKGGHGG